MEWFRVVAVGALLTLCLSGCAGQRIEESKPAAALPSSACPGIFVLAPSEYILYINGDEPALLYSEGRFEDLAVYCTPEQAVTRKKNLEASQKLYPGLWHLYLLAGVWEDSVVEVEPGEYRMRRPTELVPYPEQPALIAEKTL